MFNYAPTNNRGMKYIYVLIFLLIGCSAVQQPSLKSGTGITSLQQQIDTLQKQNDELKQQQQINVLKKENESLKQKSTKPATFQRFAPVKKEVTITSNNSSNGDPSPQNENIASSTQSTINPIYFDIEKFRLLVKPYYDNELTFITSMQSINPSSISLPVHRADLNIYDSILKNLATYEQHALLNTLTTEEQTYFLNIYKSFPLMQSIIEEKTRQVDAQAQLNH